MQLHGNRNRRVNNLTTNAVEIMKNHNNERK
ncbi:uncharacterized protein CELE_Y113G7A.22 [Caenorhabditis elegans]|uniref:Uncharacterized protein n=1 Tax=Caenorhabditis elegans TaxID=6239 RepID=F9UKU9_CAEEL|nr:Uncharacterized protein CELE_Y113G7A.22 [Caenorhabditis elegans]CCC42204.1 Uncharacterized protein CELE_Y113G7A.22 [Caenorhabditis elegans]|eukprot:NP_001256899.1 Uncharacterized protein CELE_Y113G7A.22 [Caenorhabditis elegans]